MKVSELIEKLQKVNPDNEVRICSGLEHHEINGCLFFADTVLFKSDELEHYIDSITEESEDWDL